MEKFQSKAANILNDYLKESQRKREAKKSRESHKKKKQVPSQEQFGDMRISYCSYCNKAFSESGYLVKHILRRHPDDLLHLHRQFMNGSSRQRDPDLATQPKVLPTCVENDIIDIKETLKDFKLQILEKLQLHVDDMPFKCNRDSAHKIHKSQNEELKKFCVELQELKLQCQYSETAVQNLEEKHRISLEALKRELSVNEESREQSNVRMQRMMRNVLRVQKKEITLVREEITKQLATFHQIVMSDFQKQCYEVNSKLSNIESQQMSDVQKLQSLIQVNIEKLEKRQNEQNVEKKFEYHLQNYLNKISLNPKRKLDLNKTLQHATDTTGQRSSNVKSSIPSKKREVLFGASHSKHTISKYRTIPKKYAVDDLSKYEGQLISPKQCAEADVSPTCQGPSSSLKCQGSSSSLRCQGPGISSRCQASGSSSKCQEKVTSTPKEYTSSEQKQKFKKPLFITKRVKAAMQNNPDTLDGLHKELSAVLEGKMQSFGFKPGQKRLSNVEFEAKKILVYNDLNQYGANQDFLTLRNRIDDLVTKKVESYLSHNKGVKKINFASPDGIMDSLTVSSILAEASSQPEKLNEARPYESSGFLVSDPRVLLNSSKSEMSELVLSKGVSKDSKKEMCKSKESSLASKSSLVELSGSSLNREFQQNDLISKDSLQSLASDSSETSLSLPALAVEDSEENHMSSLNSNQGTGPFIGFEHKKLKFNEEETASAVVHNFRLSEKALHSNADDIEADELDSKSSLESMSQWETDGDDDKLGATGS